MVLTHPLERENPGMAEATIRATAVRWINDHFPGLIEVEISDAEGQTHRVIEKVPVLTTSHITAASNFPLELWLDAECDSVEGESAVVRLRYNVETEEGLNHVYMALQDIRWL